MFKNLRWYRIEPKAMPKPKAVSEAVSQHILQPCGALETQTVGFVPLRQGADEPQMLLEVNDCGLIRFGKETKRIPPAVLKAWTQSRVDQEAQNRGAPLSRKEQRAIKEIVQDELLKRALPIPSQTAVFLDFKKNRIVIDTASEETGETVLSLLRSSLGSLAAVPLSSETYAVITAGWLNQPDNIPDGYSVGDSVAMRGEEGSSIRIKGDDLHSENVLAHLKEGKRVASLSMAWKDRIHTTLDEGLVSHSVKILTKEEDGDVPEDEADALTANFLLASSAIREWLDEVEQRFALPVK